MKLLMVPDQSQAETRLTLQVTERLGEDTPILAHKWHPDVETYAEWVKRTAMDGVLAELREDGTDDEVLRAAEVLARPEVQEAVSRAVQDFRRSTRRSGVTRVVLVEAVARGAPRRGWQPVRAGGVWRAERSPQAIRAAAQRVRGAVRMRGGL